MNTKDSVYGDEEIKEEVLIELINSKPFQRLKGISQQGMPRELWFTHVNSRYEHSIGVLIILRRLNAGLEEQVAGLLHDVSHTAFSHVVDWVFGDPAKEDFQDNSHLDAIKSEEIEAILIKYGFSPEKIANLKLYPLLEQDIPLICADRFDYALREMVNFESREKINLIINSIKNISGKMIFDNTDVAMIFAEVFAKCQRELWAAPIPRLRYSILSSALKKAIEEGIITKEDFRKTDAEVISILESKGSTKIIGFLNLLKNGFSYREEKGGLALVKKFRYVDPLVIHNGKMNKLSELSDSYKISLDRQKKEADKIFEAVLE